MKIVRKNKVNKWQTQRRSIRIRGTLPFEGDEAMEDDKNEEDTLVPPIPTIIIIFCIAILILSFPLLRNCKQRRMVYKVRWIA